MAQFGGRGVGTIIIGRIVYRPAVHTGTGGRVQVQQIVAAGVGAGSFLQVQIARAAGHAEDAERTLALVDATAVFALRCYGTLRQSEILVGGFTTGGAILSALSQHVGQFVLKSNGQTACGTGGLREHTVVGLRQAIAAYVTIHQPALAEAPLVVGHVLV
uniref:(northern house mosquito) hypothetical protein n=1 Tax=Culex pipiens TaxID=7175 RepID=A0A8D8CSE4_CULPI